MIISLDLPTILKNPSSSNYPRSPVLIHPPSIIVSFVFYSSPQYPFIIAYPLAHISPISPNATVLVVFGSIILSSVWGIALPTVVAFFSNGSPPSLHAMTGDVSVYPYP
jgi:hypothetical protein